MNFIYTYHRIFSYYQSFYLFIVKDTMCEVVYACGVLFSVVFYYILDQIFRKWWCPLHMYVHFYTVIGLILMLHIDYDFNQTFFRFQELFFYKT